MNIPNIKDKSLLMNNLSDLNRIRSLSEKTEKPGLKNKELMDACKDFETIFVKQMLDSMRKTINKTDISENNAGKEYFEDMLYKNYAEKITETANLGISKMMYKQLYKSI